MYVSRVVGSMNTFSTHISGLDSAAIALFLSPLSIKPALPPYFPSLSLQVATSGHRKVPSQQVN